MPRYFSDWNRTRSYASVRFLRHLLEISFNLGTTRFCNGDTITYEGETWNSAGLQFTTDLYKSLRCQITDIDGYLQSFILEEAGDHIIPLRLLLLLGDETTIPDGSADVLFQGALSSVEVQNGIVTIVGENDLSKTIPTDIASESSGFNHIPSSPLTMNFGTTDKTYQIT